LLFSNAFGECWRGGGTPGAACDVPCRRGGFVVWAGLARTFSAALAALPVLRAWFSLDG
jgi:hypothetical protein